MDGMLATGRVLKPHGIKGHLKVESLSGEIKHLLRLRSLILSNDTDARQFDVEETIKSGKGVLFKLKGIDNPEDGKLFSNWLVWVDRKKAVSRKRNEFYAADLAGCGLYVNGEQVGTVSAVCDHNSEAFLEIHGVGGDKYLFPFTEKYFGKIDLKNERIEFKEGWLLE